MFLAECERHLGKGWSRKEVPISTIRSMSYRLKRSLPERLPSFEQSNRKLAMTVASRLPKGEVKDELLRVMGRRLSGTLTFKSLSPRTVESWLYDIRKGLRVSHSTAGAAQKITPSTTNNSVATSSPILNPEVTDIRTANLSLCIRIGERNAAEGADRDAFMRHVYAKLDTHWRGKRMSRGQVHDELDRMTTSARNSRRMLAIQSRRRGRRTRECPMETCK